MKIESRLFDQLDKLNQIIVAFKIILQMKPKNHKVESNEIKIKSLTTQKKVDFFLTFPGEGSCPFQKT